MAASLSTKGGIVPQIPDGAQRLLKPFELGEQVAQGRRKAKMTQEKFASRLGISRKTLSDLERGVAEHVSLKTAMAALNLALAGAACWHWRRSGSALFARENRSIAPERTTAN